MKKSALVFLFSFVGFAAQAEHFATYCGVPLIDSRAQDDSGSRPEAVILVRYEKLAGDSWSDAYVWKKAYAGLFSMTQNHKKILMAAVKSNKKICARGYWGGSISSSSRLTSISLTSDAIQRLDYASKFNPEKEANIYGY